MCERHGHPPKDSQVAVAIYHPINLLSFIYAQVYFPTYSNGLKEITGYLGFQWSGSPLSGIEILSGETDGRSPETCVKQTLLDYNRQDCEALETLVKKLVDLRR